MADQSARRKPEDPSRFPEFSESLESYENNQFNALDRAANRLSFLSEASRRLSFALTDQECFQQLLELMIPRFADIATISLLTDQGRIKRVALAHVDPEKEKAMRTLLSNYPPELSDNYGPGYVIRTRKPEFDPNVDSHLEEFYNEFRYSELSAMARKMGVRSKIGVPLEAHGQVFGALWMADSDSGRRFDEEDLKLAEEVASRAALTAHLLLRYEKVTAIAEKLQVQREVRETYLSQTRHDVLSVLTVASLTAGMIVRKDPHGSGIQAARIIEAIKRASDILAKTKALAT